MARGAAETWHAVQPRHGTHHDAVAPRAPIDGTFAHVPKNDSLAVVAAEVAACRSCDRLVAWREQVANEKRRSYENEEYWGRGVPGFGDPKASLVVIGLAPAAHGANRTGRMFTGDRSGDFLFAGLHRAGFANQPEAMGIDDGLALSGVYITSPVKCAPPANKPNADERTNCRRFFTRELDLLTNAQVFLVLGNIGFAAACQELGVSPRPKFGHGVEHQLGNGTTLICSYHVSQQNTFTGRLTPAMFDDVLAQCRQRIDG